MAASLKASCEQLEKVDIEDHTISPIKLNSQKSYIAFFLAAFFYFYEVVLRVSPSVMTEELMVHFKMSATSLGWLTTSYYIAYFIFQIPCGMIVDRFGPRRVISGSALLCVLGTLVFCTQNHFYVAMFGRFLIGAGSACAFISCLKLAAEWFSPSKFPLMAGFANFSGTFGAVFASAPLALMVEHLSWQTAYLCLAAFGLFVAAAIWFLMGDRNQVKKNHNLLSALHQIIKIPTLWLVGAIGGILYLPITAFSELWGVPFLMRVYNVDVLTASNATIMIFIGAAIGSPVFALIARGLNSLKRTLLLSAMGSCLLFLLVLCAEIFAYEAILTILFAIGFMVGGQVLIFSIVKNITPSDADGTAMGVTNALVSSVGVIFQPFLGSVLDFFWNGQVSELGTRVYALQTYEYAIAVLPATLFFAIVLLLFLDGKAASQPA